MIFLLGAGSYSPGMKYLLYLFICLLIAPFAAAAREPFEENVQMGFRARINGLYTPFDAQAPLSGAAVPISYSLFEGLGYLHNELSTPEEELELRNRFLEYTGKYKLYAQVWKGVPHEGAVKIAERDISGTVSGLFTVSIPSSGPFFMTIVMTNELRAGGCDGPCIPVTELDSYFTLPPSPPYPIAYGGTRFSFHPSSVSSILFLPGIKGSHLYTNASDCTENCRKELWTPENNESVQALFLDEHGKSTTENVYTVYGDVLDSVLFTDIYGGFRSHLNEIADMRSEWKWEAFAYDWRLSIPDLLTNGETGEHTVTFTKPVHTSALHTALNRLRLQSQTGKVTIVAHSNGGLLAKALIQSLGDRAGEYVDKLILIGVPQAGAPQALAALLYGFREGIPWQMPLIVSTSIARQFGENAPMAYHLLPSKPYFQKEHDTLLRFDYENVYGDSIEDENELTRYLLAVDDGRHKPVPSDTHLPNVLNSALIAYAQSFHNSLDSWIPPPDIEVYQIAGWAAETVTGIEHYKDCVLSRCIIRYRPTFSFEGDGIVPASSALLLDRSSSVSNYWVDLPAYENVFSSKDHGTLLAIPEVQMLIEKMHSSDVEELPANIYPMEPALPVRHRFRLFLHSPLTLEVRDANGRYTGPDTEVGEKEEIPDSTYGVLGDVQYISLPADETYAITLRGISTGMFTLEVQEVVDEIIKNEVRFSQVNSSTSTVVNAVLSTETLSDMTLEMSELENTRIIESTASSTTHIQSARPVHPQKVHSSSTKDSPLLVLTESSIWSQRNETDQYTNPSGVHTDTKVISDSQEEFRASFLSKIGSWIRLFFIYLLTIVSSVI